MALFSLLEGLYGKAEKLQTDKVYGTGLLL